MNPNQKFNQLYREVSENMTVAMASVSELTVSNAEGQVRLDKISHQLKEIGSGFNKELEFLEENAEWEKFTMAFFGETNAGKSTIIESLRILFNESSRQEFIEKNRGDLEQVSLKLNDHAQRAQAELADAFKKHTIDIKGIRAECISLKKFIEKGCFERVKKRVRWRVIMACFTGLVVGAGAAYAVLMPLGALV